MVKVYDFVNYRDYLKSYFEDRKKWDSKFSHRYISRRLGLSSPNFILMVIQGKRNLTPSLAFKLSEELKIKDKEAEYFENMVGFLQAKTSKEKDKYFNRLMLLRRNTNNAAKIEEYQYEYYSNWYNLAVRELVTYPDFKGDYKWLAKKVSPPITPSQAKRSVELLLKLGLIKKKGKSYIRSSPVISTGAEVSSLAIVNFHKKMSEIAAHSLDTAPRDERDITSCTINISEGDIKIIKEIIADCRKKILSIAKESDPADRVYQINFQAFPITAKSRKKK